MRSLTTYKFRGRTIDENFKPATYTTACWLGFQVRGLELRAYSCNSFVMSM